MSTSYTPFRAVARGFGGGPSSIMSVGLITIPAIVDAIRESLGKKRDDGFVFDDDLSFYRIEALLREINQSPLNNVVIGKISKLIVDKRIKVDVEMISSETRKSDPYRIVIGERRIIRESNE